MAVHLTRIYTRTGDDGTTGLSDFSRVSKNDPRLVAYADCDEANAAIGVAVAVGRPDPELAGVLRQIQNDLFDAGADLSTPVVEDPEYPPLRVTQPYIDRLEKWCDTYNESLPKLNSFVLPGGSPLSALLHVARTVVRVSPVLGQPCQLNTDLAEESTPSFGSSQTLSGAAVPG